VSTSKRNQKKETKTYGIKKIEGESFSKHGRKEMDKGERMGYSYNEFWLRPNLPYDEHKSLHFDLHD
jgi:hypothetical protein